MAVHHFSRLRWRWVVRPGGYLWRVKRRRRIYLTMMAICLLLLIASWLVISRWSATAATITSVLALTIPPVAVIIANRPDH